MLKKLLWILGFIVVLVAVSIGRQTGKGIGKALFSPSEPSQQDIEAKLIEGFTTAANQFNKKLPMMLDKDTRLNKATVGPGARAVYHHTLMRYASKNIDKNVLLSNLRPKVMKKVCTNNSMKRSLQYGGVYVYAYSGSDGVEIARFEINRNDCGLPKIGP